MEIYTIGFTQKSAELFFETLKGARIRLLIDIRLNNSSQLAGFTKRFDLVYFLKEICDIEYLHLPILAPSEEIFEDFKKKKGSWEIFESAFLSLMKEREVERAVDRSLFKKRPVLLCSEPEPDHCHRRLVAEYLREKWGDIEIIHL